MATIEQLGEALKRADAAGNADDARALAAAIQQMRTSAPAPAPATAPQTPAQPQKAGPGMVEGGVRSLARGVPVVGSLLDELSAAWQASLSPIAEQRAQLDAKVGAKNPVQMPIAPGRNFVERYDSALGMQRGTDKAFDEQHPVASTGLKIAGGVASGLGAVRAAPAAANAVMGITRSTAPLITKMAAGAASGGVLGAAHGFGEGEGTDNRLAGAKTGGISGALVGGAVPAVAHVAGRAAGTRPPAAPTVGDLRDEANQLYDAARNAGVVISRNSFRNTAQTIQNEMANEGIDQTLHPRALAALRRITDVDENITLDGVETLRRVVGAAAGSQDPSERRLAGIMQDRLDDYLENLNPQDVIGGNTNQVGQVLQQARQTWGRMRKGEAIENLIERAQTRASQFSGSGLENAIRTEFRQLAMNQRAMRRFTPEERDAIQTVVRGGPIGNAMRFVGKFAPRGVVGTTLSALGGFGVGGPVGAVGALTAGELGRHGATAATQRNAMAAAELMRRGGPAPAGVPSAQTDDLMRILMQSAAPAQLPSARRAPQSTRR